MTSFEFSSKKLNLLFSMFLRIRQYKEKDTLNPCQLGGGEDTLPSPLLPLEINSFY